MNALREVKSGYLEEYEGIEFMMDPESFVDFGVSLSRKINQSRDDKGEIIIWRHIQANKSRHFYFVSQSYWHRPKNETDIIYAHDTRAFSFHGLYRKYSEADLFEAIRIKNCTMRNKILKEFDKRTLFCTFKDSTIFSAYFNEIKFYGLIVKYLESAELNS